MREIDPEAVRDLELEPTEFRQVFDRPLGKPVELRRALALWLAITLASAAIAGWIGGFWSPFLVIPSSLWAGAALAGLWPRWFFGKGDDI